MDSLFEDIQRGLQEAIAHAKGEIKLHVTKYEIVPVNDYSGEQIQRIRIYANLTQFMFAEYMGVSVKTVDAWENNRSHPNGPARRLISILESDGTASRFVKRTTQIK